MIIDHFTTHSEENRSTHCHSEILFEQREKKIEVLYCRWSQGQKEFFGILSSIEDVVQESDA